MSTFLIWPILTNNSSFSQRFEKGTHASQNEDLATPTDSFVNFIYLFFSGVPFRGNVPRKAERGNTGLCCQELLSAVIKRTFERG